MKKVFLLVMVVVLAFVLTACRQAERVSYNVSKEADNFNVVRRISVFNMRSDKPLFELIGQFSIQNSASNEIEVICLSGPHEYKKHFIYLNDWNEWTAGKYKSGLDPGGHAPGPDGFLERKNPFYFVDQYNAEYNRTIAPMKGGYTDNYYMQMVQNIRRYKGVRPIPENKGLAQIGIDGNMADWQPREAGYRDTKGDTAHRDHPGYGDLHYTDKSGRNDIVASKVATDGKNLYFYAETAGSLSPETDNNWMLLFIDADQSVQTGWGGYDYMVAQQMLCRYDKEMNGWVEVAPVQMARNDNALEMSVPRSSLGMKGSKMNFDFKWADNPTTLDNVISLCTHGDTAPNRRFNFRYIWKK